MEKTENFNLNRWEPADEIRVEDFNDNSDKIDEALAKLTAGMPKIVCGTYTGNGAASQTIELGFTPKAVLVVTTYGQMQSSPYYNGGLAVTDNPVKMGSTGHKVVEIIENGFNVYHNTTVSSSQYVFANANTLLYHYLAVG